MLIVDGKLLWTPDYSCLNWTDNPAFRVKMPEDGKARGGLRVNMAVIHTTEGKRATYKPGHKEFHQGAQQYIKSWRNSPREASAHLLIGWDGIVYQIADLHREMTYHTPGVNGVSIGIEIVQIDGVIYEDQMKTLGHLCKHIAQLFGIQMMVSFPYHGRAVERITQGKFFGFTSHRDVRNDRGYGDCNDEPLMVLRDQFGFEAFDVSKGEDVAAWRVRQASVGLKADGMPGKATRDALLTAGYKMGMWVLGR